MSQPEDFMFMHSLGTLSRTEGHFVSERLYNTDLKYVKDHLKSRVAGLEATTMHMSEKLRSKTSEMQAKVNQMAD